MAATGVPEPRPDHALAMALFAQDCVAKMKVLVMKLEVLLGPGKKLLKDTKSYSTHAFQITHLFSVFLFF
jgi:hypothetical protein